jgi:hypothetical protein
MAAQLYAVEVRSGEWVAYERHPVPGGKDLALVSRSSEEAALEAARVHLKSKGGSAFKAERSVVGA